MIIRSEETGEYRLVQLCQDGVVTLSQDIFGQHYILLNCTGIFKESFPIADMECVEDKKELTDLYNFHMADRQWGWMNWAAAKRKQLPLKKILDKIIQGDCPDTTFREIF